jgi:dihydroorotate dehydrogenase electron transfer subunit
MPVDALAEILSNTRLAPDYNVVTFRAPQIAGLAAPGQFVMVRCAQGLDPVLRRPFSIFEHVRDPEGRLVGLSILNKRVGVGTSRLYDVKPGECLSVLGPLGRPFVPVSPPDEAWMVAGGVGLAPFATLAAALAERGTAATLFYGGRSSRDIYYEDFFARLGTRLIVTTEDGSRGEKGRVTAPLERELAARTGSTPSLTIYACGPTPMMRAVAGVGAAAGRRVLVSLEPVMGCGMGGCYSCVVPVKQGSSDRHFVRSCIEGPVFDAHSLVWDAMASTGH